MTPRMDDFVAKIVTDPRNPPNTLLLKGYIGASSEEGHVRLYLDSELSDYVEVPEAAILHSQDIPKDKSPIGGSYVWIQRDATVIHGAAVSERPKASFLQGRIMGEQGNVAPAPLAQTVSGPGCNTIIDGCTDAGPKCPTSVGKTCPDPCTSSGVACTQSGPNCPTKPGNPSCTQSGPSCPTKPGNPSCTQSGPSCPTTQGNTTCVDPACTSNGPNCPTTPLYTCSGPNCPTTPEATCCGPNCPTFPATTCNGPKCQTASPNATCPAPTCTQSGPNCPTVSPNATCPAPTCTQTGPNCTTLVGQAGCTSSGIHCPTSTGHVTCAPSCTQSGPVCQTKTGSDCPFPTEAGKTCVAPCHPQ